MNSFFAEACHLLPIIKRARDFYLYTPDSKRYLDMFLCRGAAILGHGGQGYGLAIKNTTAQNMYMPYPNLWEKRLYAFLKKRFPTYHACVLSHSPCDPSLWYEPWQVTSACDYALWRPGLPPSKARFLALVVPLSYQPCWIILSREPYADIPTPVPATLARLLLKALQAWDIAQTLSSIPHTWQKFFPSYISVYGRYFFSTLSHKEHDALFTRALQQCIILPPKPYLAGAWPLKIGPHDEKYLKQLLA